MTFFDFVSAHPFISLLALWLVCELITDLAKTIRGRRDR